MAETAQPAAAKIGIEVGALQRRHGGPAIYIPAYHRTSSAEVRIIEHRKRKTTWVAIAGGVETESPLHQSPAVIGLTPCIGGDGDIDLFSRILSYIADVEVSGLAIKGETPRVPKAKAPNLLRAADEDKRIDGDIAAGAPCIGIESKEFPEQ